MGSHWKNCYVDSHVHHVTCTVHKWQKALLYPKLIDSLYNEFDYTIARWKISIIGYVIMPEHFHALIFCENGQNVLKAIHGIRRSVSGVARRIVESGDSEFNDFCRLNRVNMNLFFTGTCGKSAFRFWKEKPRVFPMNFEDAIKEKLDYIHNNPLRRGLVKSVEEWEYSSARAYIYGNSSRVLLGYHSAQDAK